ncbi:MAG: NAD(P)H-quinone oxidoreductase [Myxococcaceae bacterium]
MKALVMKGTGGPEILALEEVADPRPGRSDVVVRVHATALNRADLLQLRGMYAPPPGVPADIPGIEYAGEVLEVGQDVQGLRPGDRVMGLVGGGAFAERVVVHEREAVRIPSNLSFDEAAAIPEAFITAHDALVSQGGLRSGEAVLIHAVASGVGTAGVQIVRALGGSALGTARTEEKLQRVQKELGLDVAIPCPAGPVFKDAVRKATGGRGAALALELVGGDYVPETIASLAPRGRVVLVGLLAGNKVTADLGRILTQRITLIGTVLRSRPLEEKIAAARTLEAQLVPLFEREALRPVIDVVLPMSKAGEAFKRLASNLTFGKVVLRW